ncbi:MAG: hemolysin III family protein, partial [Spirochaetales bacterium]|nr:hemolysin III family protein [Spirochaetales bacterium]
MKKWIMEHIPLPKPLSKNEELINGFTHAAGALACIPAFVLLVHTALQSGVVWYTVAAVIFMLSMTVLYSASAFYHLSNGPLVKRVGRIFDHASIYLLIAGTYTPVAFKIQEPWGVVILSLVWGIALFGFILKIAFWGKFKVLHLLVYLGMGWTIVFFWPVVTARVPAEFIRFAFFGGGAYTL